MLKYFSKQKLKIKKNLWPIEKTEYKKFIPLFLIFFLASFNFNLLRATKDTLVITAPNANAEILPYIKTWVKLPFTVLVTFFISKFSIKFSGQTVFYIIISAFILFFLSFTFMIYPLKDLLHPVWLTQKLELLLPAKIKTLSILIYNWPYTMFYMMAELWTFVILMLWSTANEITPLPQAKRFYSLFSMATNIAIILAGKATIYLSGAHTFISKINFGTTSWDKSLCYLNSLTVLIAVSITFIFYVLNKGQAQKLAKTLKSSPSLKEVLSFLKKSKYLFLLSLIIICYNVTVNLLEPIWKNQVKALYPSSNDFNVYMGKYIILIGIISTGFSFFALGNFLRKFNWTINAMLSPIITIITGSLFFSIIIKNTPTTILSASALALSVFYGTIHNCSARVLKYTVLDTTKDLALIPLDTNSKKIGKTIIDGTCTSLGQAGGCFIFQGMLLLSSFCDFSSCIYSTFCIFVLIWAIASIALGKQFNIITKQQPL